MTLLKNNKYDTFLFLLVFSLLFGNIGDALQIVRIVTIVLSPFLFKHLPRTKYYTKGFVVVFIFFWLYAGLSMLWTNDPGEGFKALAYHIVHFVLFLEIIVFAKFANNPLKTISFSWVLAVAGTLVIAIWEIATDNHLALSKFDSGMQMIGEGEVLVQRFASVTFGNYNGYVTYLCFAFPFLFYYLSTSSKTQKVFTFFVILLAFATILYNASRGGLVSFAIMVFLYTMRPPKMTLKLAVVGIFVLIVAPFLIQHGSTIFAVISMRAKDGGLFEDSIRSQLAKDSLSIFLDSFGLGVGVSGLPGALKKMGSFVTIPHNMFLELLVEYGIVFFVIFILYIIKLFLVGRKNPLNQCHIVTYLFILALPFFSIIDSVYLLNPIVFVGFACLTVYSRICTINPSFIPNKA